MKEEVRIRKQNKLTARFFHYAKKAYLMSAWGGNVQKAGKNLREDKIAPVYDITIDYIKRQKVVSAPEQSNVRVLDSKR
jgi:sulfur-oxidizing protein SoxB